MTKPSKKVENFGAMMTAIIIIMIPIGIYYDGIIRIAASIIAFIALSEICMTVIINIELNNTPTKKKDLRNTATIFMFKIGSFMLAGTMVAILFMFYYLLVEAYNVILSVLPLVLPSLFIITIVSIYIKANKKVMNHIFETNKK